MPLRGIALMALIIGSVPLSFVRPFYGILVWTVISFVNPQQYTWSAVSVLPWAMIIAIPTLGGMFLFSNWMRGLSSRLFPLIALWLWVLITSLISVNSPLFVHHSADTWERLSFISKVLSMTIAMICIVDNFALLRTLVMVTAGCFGIFVVKSIPFIIMTGGAFRLYGPDHSMISDNNDFGLALNMTIPLFFFLALSESRPWLKKIWGILFLATIPCVFFTYSRGALIGLIAVVTLLLLRSRKRMLLIPAIAIGVMIVMMFAPESWKHRMDPTREDAVDASAKARFNSWQFAWGLATDYPLTGGGFGTFTPQLFERYAPNATDIHGPHSVYFQMLAEHGFPGLFLYLYLLGYCFWKTSRLISTSRRRGDEVCEHYANMFRFSIIGFMVSGLFLGRAYFDYFFSIVAFIIILDTVATREREVDEADPEEECDLAVFEQRQAT